MTKDTEVLSANQEFFTVVTTGETGISVRGLARLSGIPQKTLSRWFESDLSGKGVPEPLKALAIKGDSMSHGSTPEPLKALAIKGDSMSHGSLYLSQEVKVRNRPIKAVRSDVADEIIEYAAFDLFKTEAREAMKLVRKIGLNSYIQGVTGYLPEKYQASSQSARYEITRLVRGPNPWKLLYSAETCEKIRRWYFPKDFFWSFAYYWMTPEEIEFLNEHNPVQEGIWQRRDRIFQFLSQETRDRLAPEIMKLCTLVESSTGRQDFETRWHRVHGRDQQEFDLA